DENGATWCALAAESEKLTVLIVEASIFNDVVYPSADMNYSMEKVRSIMWKPPQNRTLDEIRYIGKAVMSKRLAFLQMSAAVIHRLATQATMDTVEAGTTIVSQGQRLKCFYIMLHGSAAVEIQTRGKRGGEKTARLAP
ncbi:unnamed protein product, partial [Chrysoparadoxa australica]